MPQFANLGIDARSHIARLILGVLALLLLVYPGAVAAQDQGQEPTTGTALVCVGLGGDGLSLAEWTPEQIADYESRAGSVVLRAHPETGECTDPAGLTVGVGWTPGWAWLCAPDASGEWGGPYWIAPIYQRGTEAPPSPVTGDCPQPIHYPRVARTVLMTAAATAVHLTQLEASGDYARLYAWMHPDSSDLVPRSVVESWYRAEFAAQAPVFAAVERVRLTAWQWGVTGVVYPSVAEVTLRLRTPDGQERLERVRLVRDNGVWRWFFGRDRAWLNDQIARFS